MAQISNIKICDKKNKINYLNYKENYMKTIKIFLLTFIMFQSSANFADVGEVYQWKAFPGKTQQMLENMQEAAKIHEAEGAVVAIDYWFRTIGKLCS
jgi:hypothetical protein